MGRKQSSNHIWIRGDIRAGRSEQVRESLISNIAADVSTIAKTSLDNVWVYVCSLAPTDMIEYGHVLPRAGMEQEWFDNLPASLKAHILEFAKKDSKFTL